MYSIFGQIGPQTRELDVLEHLKITSIKWGKCCLKFFLVVYFYLRTIQTLLMALLTGSQVSDRCPLCYLFYVD